MKTTWTIVGAISVALLTGGCNGGGGGLFSLFSGTDSAEDALSSFSSGSGDGGSSPIGDLAGGPGGGGADSAASLHNPEPGSIALFGGGLAGLGLWRRRRSRAKNAKRAS